MPKPDRIIRLKTVLNRSGLSRSTVYRKIKEGTFPRQIPISANGCGWAGQRHDMRFARLHPFGGDGPDAILKIKLGPYCKARLVRADSPADPKAVIDAVARRNQIRVLVDGMTAVNDLGFTNSVRAKTIVHTDACAQRVRAGRDSGGARCSRPENATTNLS
jgi:predicted DNA-binding transcriptional regulator AlpA